MASDAVANLRKTAQFLDVQMNEITGSLAFVAPDGFGRVQPVTAIESHPFENMGDC